MTGAKGGGPLGSTVVRSIAPFVSNRRGGAAEQDLEELWALGVISDEALLLGSLPDEELWALGVISDEELLRRAA